MATVESQLITSVDPGSSSTFIGEKERISLEKEGKEVEKEEEKREDKEGKEKERERENQRSPLPGSGSPTLLVRDSVETNLLASRLEALNIELFRDPRIAKFFEKRNDEIDWKWWGLLVSDHESVMKKSYKSVVEKIRKGIPKQMRGLVWQTLTASKSLELEAQYQYYVAQDSIHEKVIARDVNRTFPHHEYFQKEAGQMALLAVVKAYSNYDHELGYCQGLGFVTGVLLMHMPPEEAFCVLIQLLAHYQLRFLFVEGMEGVHVRMYQLEALMKEHLPSLHQHFQQIEIKTTMFASSWFLTLFATDFPLDVIYRIFDIVLLEGSSVLFNFSLAILKRSQADLLKMNFEGSMEILKDKLYDKFSGADELVEEAFKFKITTKKIEKLEKEAREYFDAKSNEEKQIQTLTHENIQLESEVEMYRNLFSDMEQKNKQLEDDTSRAQEQCVQLQQEKQSLSNTLEELKSSLTEEQYSMYTNLEQQLQMYKSECGKFVAQQSELESDLIETKLKYALAESERQRLLIRTQPRRPILEAPRKLERVVTEAFVNPSL